MQRLILHNQINFFMRKIPSNNLAAGMLSTNFKEKIEYFIANNQAFTFINCIKRIPA